MRKLALVLIAIFLSACSGQSFQDAARHAIGKPPVASPSPQQAVDSAAPPRCAELVARALIQISGPVAGAYNCLSTNGRTYVSKIPIRNDEDFVAFAQQPPTMSTIAFSAHVVNGSGHDWYAFQVGGSSDPQTPDGCIAIAMSGDHVHVDGFVTAGGSC